MAEHGMIVETSSPDDFDMEAHRQTYRSVIALFKWGSVAAALVLIFLFRIWY